MKYYVGLKEGSRELFRYHKTPEHSDGLPYIAVIGPFRTKRGDIFMRDFGKNNPHCRMVSEAEKLGKKYA